MLLSDTIILIGMEANPKNNLSMGNKSLLIKEEIKKAKANHTDKQLVNIVNFACNELNKNGFKYYTPEILIAL